MNRGSDVDYSVQYSGWPALFWSSWTSAMARQRVLVTLPSPILKSLPIWTMKNLCSSTPPAANLHTMPLAQTLPSMTATATQLPNPRLLSALHHNSLGQASTHTEPSQTLLLLDSLPVPHRKTLASVAPCNMLTHMLPYGML